MTGTRMINTVQRAILSTAMNAILVVLGLVFKRLEARGSHPDDVVSA